MTIIYWAETYLLQKNNENLLVVTKKTGHEFNAEKPEHMFVFCDENVEEFHNINVSNIFAWANFNKSKLHSQINVKHFKLRWNLLPFSTVTFFSARSQSKNTTTNIHTTIILSAVFLC